MIAATVEELTPIIGTRPACRALGASPATIYRRRRPPEPKPPRPRPTPARALSGPERQQVLRGPVKLLNSKPRPQRHARAPKGCRLTMISLQGRTQTQGVRRITP